MIAMTTSNSMSVKPGQAARWRAWVFMAVWASRALRVAARLDGHERGEFLGDDGAMARDFRVESLGKAYTSTVLQPQADGTYVGHVDTPAKGFSAFFVELTWDSGLPSAPFSFTTEVSIVPDTLPFKWEDAAKKYAATKPK